MTTRHIADPVHGAIDLDSCEFELIDTPSFQRLRRIKQLSMASQVYPGADHSRFVHSLGAFAIMSRLASRLRETNSKQVKPKDMAKLRLAALLHDIGHYPYSHLMEKVSLPGPSDGASGGVIEPKKRGDGLAGSIEEFPEHEQLGELVVTQRDDVKHVLKSHRFSPREIASIFRARHPEKTYLNRLMSSALDVDRLDYLLRDAHFTGVPFGRVDVDYILRNIVIDEEGEVCITPKAVASTEHFLLSRWYNYGAVVYQKTVVAMERLMRAVIERLVKAKTLPHTPMQIEDIVTDWAGFLGFDDHFVDSAIRTACGPRPDSSDLTSSEDGVTSLMSWAVVNRVKPRCVYEARQEPGQETTSNGVFLFEKHMPKAIQAMAERHSIPIAFWLTADSDPRTLEEAKPQRGIQEEELERSSPSPRRQRALRKLVRVATPAEKSKPLLDLETSLLRPLRTATFRVVRVYVLFPEEVAVSSHWPATKSARRPFKEQAAGITRDLKKELGL